MAPMKKTLSRIFGGATGQRDNTSPAPPPQPKDTFVAVGDLHGCSDLLNMLGLMIEKQYFGYPVVFLGDYVDRGENTRRVLDLLMRSSPDGPHPVTCLMGNHEKMLLDFLDDPARAARPWLRNGGLQTLASFGVAPASGGMENANALEALRDRLADSMGETMINWLRDLPLSWQSGNVWAVHAGADPRRPMEAQDPERLLWGHPRFSRQPRRDGQWVVHGHTVVHTPEIQGTRIAVDTGAYATGVLSAAVISDGDVAFFQAATR